MIPKLRRLWNLVNPFSVSPPAAVVFLYHTVEDRPNPWTAGHRYVTPFAAFRKQIDYIRARFEVLKTEDLIGRLGQGNLEKPLASIHFDDGFDSYKDIVVPYFEKREIPSAVFLIESVLLRNVPARNQIAFCFNQGWGEKLQKSLGLFPQPMKQFLSWSKERSTPEMVSQIHEIYRQCHAEYGGEPPFLNRAEVKGLASNAYVELGSHTKSHRMLAALDEATQREEILGGHAALEDLADKSLSLFAYPFGAPHHFNSTSAEIVLERGLTAFSSYGGVNKTYQATDMKRITLTADSPWEIERKIRIDGYRDSEVPLQN